MSELRWTLLILGVVFIAALTWWERRRPRQAFAPRLRDASQAHGGSRGDAQRTAGPDAPVSGEPWIGEAGLADVVSSDATFPGAADTYRPVGENSAHAHVEPSLPGPLEELPTLVIPDAEEQLALQTAWDAQPPEPTLIDPEASDTAPADAPGALEATQPAPAKAPGALELAQPAPAEAPEPAPAPAHPPAAAREPEREILGAEGVGAVRIVERFPAGDGSAPPEPIVEWPPEESRRILALRLIAPQPERFPGRTLRLALAAEGFLLGKFAIFHKPDESNRAVLSAASLTRPGAFDLETMDSQRYGGLSLFAVLPGPKPPVEAFEELLATARNLNERLQGALQDERGGPLTPLRVATVRESLRAEAATLSAAHEA
jgi:cell division protein ZipA